MSNTLFAQAMQSTTVPQPLLSVEAAFANYAEDQLEIADGEMQISSLEHNAAVLKDGLATLESIQHQLMAKQQSESGVDTASLEAYRVQLTHMFGEDVLYGDQSLESFTDPAEYTLESIKDLIKTVGSKLGKVDAKLKENLSWMHSKYFGGFKKTQAFFKSAEAEAKKIKGDTPNFVSVSDSVLNALAIDGEVSAAKIIPAMTAYDKYIQDVAKALPACINKIKGLEKAIEKEVLALIEDKVEDEDSWDKVSEKYRDQALAFMDPIAKLSEKMVGTQLPGGYQFVKTKLKEGSGISVFEVERQGKTTATITPMSSADLAKFSSVFESLSKTSEQFKSSSDIIATLLAEVAEESEKSYEIGKDISNDAIKGIVLLTVIGLIMVTLAMVFPPASPVAAGYIKSFIQGWFIGTGVHVIFAGITRNIPNEQFFGRSKELVEDVSKGLVRFAKYQNRVTKQGAVLVNAHLKAFGASEKPIDTSDVDDNIEA